MNTRSNTRIKKWLRRLLITVASCITICFVLAIVFSEVTCKVLQGIGYFQVYNGNDERGNQIMNFAISKMKNPDEEVYHELSVQNTKNGNYDIAISALEKSYELNPKEMGGYYGWVLLYYYHDYEKALKLLEIYDNYTPNFSDAPVGEDIHYLKGLAHMQLRRYKKAVHEFNIHIEETSISSGEEWVNTYAYVNKGRCLSFMNQFDEAIKSYRRAINQYDKCVEAYYFLAQSQVEIDINEKACQNYRTALDLLRKGYKSSDPYVEFFHEVYESQIEKSISKNCLK